MRHWYAFIGQFRCVGMAKFVRLHMLDIVVSAKPIVESSDRVGSERFSVLHKDKLSLIFAAMPVGFELLIGLD